MVNRELDKYTSLEHVSKISFLQEYWHIDIFQNNQYQYYSKSLKMHSYGHWSLVNQFGGSDAFTLYFGGQECLAHFLKVELLSWKMLAQSNSEYSLLLVIGRLQPGRLQKRKESCDKFEANRFSDNLRRNRLRRKIKLVTSQSISLTQLSIIRVCGELINLIVFNGLGKLFQFWFSFKNSLDQLWLNLIGGATVPCVCVCVCVCLQTLMHVEG